MAAAAPGQVVRRGNIVPIVVATAGFALLLHMIVANRYGFFRDELYFIICGRHPSFGYVDQPPLIPLLAAATQIFGHDLVLLRTIPALAAAGTVVVGCLFARLAGGGRYAVALAGITIATAPMYVGIGGTFNTSVFEPVAWTLFTYLLARAAVLDDRRALLWAGVTLGLALEAKYQMPFYAAPLGLALLLTRERSVLWTREAGLGLLIAVALAAPSFIWQAANHFPFAELIVNGASGKNNVQPPVAFIVNQIFVMNPLFAPVWIAGVVACFNSPRFARVRFIGLGFVLTFALMMLLHAKDYYLAGLYAPSFALGAVVVERFLRAVALRAVYPALAVALATIGWPNALPLFYPPQYLNYMHALPFLRPQEQEKSFHGQLLPQNLADQLGWEDLTRDVAAVYNALPAQDRAKAAIIASNYGEAGALDFFGKAYGLPPVLSGHNQYWLWGTRGYDGSIIIYVNSFELQFWRKYCKEAHVAGTFGRNPYVEPYEHDRPIVLCRGLFEPLATAWPKFKSYE